MVNDMADEISVDETLSALIREGFTEIVMRNPTTGESRRIVIPVIRPHAPTFKVHIAGSVLPNGTQKCVRCGLMLVDSRGLMAIEEEMGFAPRARFYPLGGFVGQGNRGGFIRMDHDATEADETACQLPRRLR